MRLFHHCYNLQPTTLTFIITYSNGDKDYEYNEIKDCGQLIKTKGV